MTKEQTVKESWIQRAEEWSNDNSQFTDSNPEMEAYIEGISDFQSAFKEEIEKEIEEGALDKDANYFIGLERCLELIYTTQPTKP